MPGWNRMIFGDRDSRAGEVKTREEADALSAGRVAEALDAIRKHEGSIMFGELFDAIIPILGNHAPLKRCFPGIGDVLARERCWLTSALSTLSESDRQQLADAALRFAARVYGNTHLDGAVKHARRDVGFPP